MKTIRFIALVFFTFLFFNLNAQVFVGGNLGFNTSGGSHDNGTVKTDNTTSTGFTFAPKIGKFLSDKTAIGIALNLSLSRITTPGNPETINTSSGFGINPFLRYYAVRMDKFAVFGQANIEFSYAVSKQKEDGVTTDGPKITRFSLSLVPGLSYDISDKLSLETTINILNLGFYDSIQKDGTNTYVSTSFTAGAGLSNIVTLGTISIGAIYKF
jgi:hypothetical protein